ncbi:MAG: hypothetical protein IJ489_08885 [Clostridia bacterium]|nr:hypothetical protein [Clostridia bacterium]
MLYQPSDILPSTFAGFGGGIVAAEDDFSVSWRVNGNSPMTAFQIEIFHNDSASTSLYSTGIISAVTDDMPNGFYGTDNKGNPIPFVYPDSIGKENFTWKSIGISNGNEYKLKITQYWGKNRKNSVSQYSESVFFARTNATVTINSFPTVIDTAEITFTAVYKQAEGDSINYVRWQFASLDGQGNRMVLDDTGEIYTGNLSYSYSGLLTGNAYSVNVIAQTEYGYITPDNWHDFTVYYEEAEAVGGISVECGDGYNLISWARGVDIPGIPSPENDYGSIANGKLYLKEQSTVIWDEVNGEKMNFSAPYSVVFSASGIKTPIQTENFLPSSLPCTLMVVSPNETYLAAVFQNGNETTLSVYDLTKNRSLVFSLNTNTKIYTVSFSPRETFMFVGGDSFNTLYKNENDYFYNMGSVTNNSASINGSIYCSAFIFEGETNIEDAPVLYLCIGGDFADRFLCGWFLSTNTSFSLINKINAASYKIPKYIEYDGGGILISGEIREYSADTDSEGFASYYSVEFSSDGPTNDTTFTFEYNLLIDHTHPHFKIVKAINTSIGIIAFGERAALFTGSGTDYTLHSYLSAIEEKAKEIHDIVEWNGYFVIAANDTYGYLFNYTDGQMVFYKELTDNGSKADGDSFTISPNMFSNGIAVGGNFSGGDIAFLFNDSYLDPLLSINSGEMSLINQKSGLLFSRNLSTIVFQTEVLSDTVLIGISQNQIYIRFSNENGFSQTITQTVSYEQSPLSFLGIGGEQQNDFLYVSSGDYHFSPQKPSWNSETLFYTDYRENTLQGGTLSTGAMRNALFRLKEGENSLIPIFKVPTMITQIKDFGVLSLQRYSYEMFYITTGATYSAPSVSDTVCRRFRSFYLFEATPDADIPNVYHVLKTFRFGNNVDAGAVSNNNSPNFLLNFTPYRLRQPSSQMGKSGTLTALLSNFKNGVYSDSAAMMDALFEASKSKNTFFLKDMKGNLYNVHISAPITQTVNTKSSVQEVLVSVPWEEVGDASDIALIQTPLDEGWNNNMVFGVRLNADVYTGNLSAVYPENYEGTTFDMTGNTLTAETSDGITKVDFDLTDGTLSVSERL